MGGNILSKFYSLGFVGFMLKSYRVGWGGVGLGWVVAHKILE